MGKTHLHQIQIVQEFVGKLSEEDLNSIDDLNSRDYLLSNEKKLGLDQQKDRDIWQTKFPGANPLAIDLLQKLLAFNP
jgi:hypothetical protein